MLNLPKKPSGEANCSLQFNHEHCSGMPAYLTVKDVASYLQISVASVYRLLDNRQLTFVKVGGAIRVYQVELSRYLQACTVDAIRE